MGLTWEIIDTFGTASHPMEAVGGVSENYRTIKFPTSWEEKRRKTKLVVVSDDSDEK